MPDFGDHSQDINRKVDDLKKELEDQKKTAKIYLVIGVISASVLGFILGKVF